MMGHGYTGGKILEADRSLAEDRKKRDQYWRMLRSARHDFVGTGNSNTDPYAFSHYLQQNYGLRPELDAYSNYSNEYTVIDEKKYLLFLLKYGS
jgi:hypothetical protein